MTYVHIITTICQILTLTDSGEHVKKSLRVLLVEDDLLARESFKLLVPNNWELTILQDIKFIPNQFFHVAFVDIHLSQDFLKKEGLEVIKNLLKKNPQTYVIAISGDLSRDLMEEALLAGASRYLAKPLSSEEIRVLLDKSEAFFILQDSSLRLASSFSFIGTSPVAQSIRRQIADLKGEEGSILIEGETGAGKEVVSQLIHNQESHRPFVSVNVSTIPEHLFESELFGHIKGSFTGAISNQMGLAEAAHGGFLFLDEIETLSLACQAKLLRFLETHEIRRVGDKNTVQVDVRVIAATNQNLENLASRNLFREDLMWRLNGAKIYLPPLRERPEDVEELAQYFLKHRGSHKMKSFTEEALATLKKHSWPGNVRELKRVIEQVALTSPLPIIRQEDLSPFISSYNRSQNSEEFNFHMGLSALLKEYERTVIQKCLEVYEDVDLVAQTLQMSRSGLYKKIKEFDLKV